MKTTLLFLTMLAVTITTVPCGRAQGSPGAAGNPNTAPPANGQMPPPSMGAQPPNNGATPAPAPGTAAPNTGAVNPSAGTVVPPAGTVIPPSRIVPPSGNAAVAPNTGTPPPNLNPNSPNNPGTNGFQAPGAPNSNANSNGFFQSPRGGGFMGGSNGSINQ